MKTVIAAIIIGPIVIPTAIPTSLEQVQRNNVEHGRRPSFSDTNIIYEEVIEHTLIYCNLPTVTLTSSLYSRSDSERRKTISPPCNFYPLSNQQM